MKKILLAVVAAIMTVSAHSQDIRDYFPLKLGTVTWQKVFTAGTKAESLANALYEKGLLSEVSITENRISGRTVPMEMDYKGAGYSRMGIAMYIRDQRCQLFFVIEVRDGRYRVTARNFVFQPKYDSGLMRKGDETEIEKYAIGRDGEYKDAFFNGPAQSIDKTLTELFFVESIEAEDEW